MVDIWISDLPPATQDQPENDMHPGEFVLVGFSPSWLPVSVLRRSFVRFHITRYFETSTLQKTPRYPRYRYQQRHPLPAIFDDFSNLSRFLDSTSILCGDTVFNSQPSAVYPSNLFWTDSLAFVNNTYPILPPSYGALARWTDCVPMADHTAISS